MIYSSLIRYVLCIPFCVLLSSCTKSKEEAAPVRHNKLILGDNSDRDVIKIGISNPVDLNTTAFDSILAVRANELGGESKLLLAPYVPSQDVFKRVNPKGAWVSLAGFFYVGAVPSAYIGNSFESISLLNPMLLLSANVLGSSVHTPNRINWINKDPMPGWAQDPQFPFAPTPKKIEFFPKKRELLIEYDLTEYSQKIAPYLTEPLLPSPTTVTFSAYNARDLGFQSIKLIPERSTNVDLSGFDQNPNKITDILGFWPNWFGRIEGYNHQSQNIKLLSSMPIQSLGATICFGLWENLPEAIGDTKPELVVTVSFL